MNFLEVSPSQVPMCLLLEADPSATSIKSYLPDSWCFVAKGEVGKIIGACILKETDKDVVELSNISVYPELQAKGIGSKLLQYVISKMKTTSTKRIELGTGSFGHQLTFYQRLGFRVCSVWKDYFIANYPEPLYENGMQHIDMLRLYLNVTSPSPEAVS